MELTYQQKVMLALLELAKENREVYYEVASLNDNYLEVSKRDAETRNLMSVTRIPPKEGRGIIGYKKLEAKIAEMFPEAKSQTGQEHTKTQQRIPLAPGDEI